MALKDVLDTISDLGSTGLVVSRKIFARSLADERDVDHEMTARLIDNLHPSRFAAVVAEVADETATTTTIRLVPEGAPFPPFRAGQFVTLFVEVEGVRTARAYSISSPPSRPAHLDLTVRKMPSGFVSAYLCEQVKAGDRFELAGPAGSFYHEPLTDGNDLVFLAGGSGITPFMSMIRDEVETRRGLKMHLLYGSRTMEDIIFEDELSSFTCSEPFLKTDYIISEPTDSFTGLCGLLDTDMIRERVGDVEGKTFFICGPHAMYGLCGSALAGLGVRKLRVKSELSGPPPDITVVEGWPAEVKTDQEYSLKVEGSRKKMTCTAGEPLLNSLERYGLTIDSVCRSGACGACRIKLASGEVFMPATATLRKSDIAFGYVHPCLSYPLSDVTLRL